MKIARIETCARCRLADFSFLKVTTDDGLVGWSEYTESFGSRRPVRGDRGADAAS